MSNYSIPSKYLLNPYGHPRVRYLDTDISEFEELQNAIWSPKARWWKLFLIIVLLETVRLQ
jgi:hypothetical protein